MQAASKHLRKAQLRDALIFWIYIPAAVILGGLGTDLLLELPPLPHPRELSVASLPLLIAGLCLILKATSDLKRFGDGTPNPRAPAKRLVTEGSYSLCRHPMFLGYDLAALGTVFLFHSWGMLALAYPVFIFLQNRFLKRREEAILARRFGSTFAEYRARTPFLVPNPFAGRKVP